MIKLLMFISVYCMMFLIGSNVIISGVLLPQIKESFHIGYSESGALMAIMVVPVFVMTFLSPFLIAKLNPIKLFSMMLFTIIAGLLLSYFSSNYLMYLLSRFIYSIGGGFFFCWGTTIVTNDTKADDKNSNRSLTFLNAFYSIGTIFPPIVVAFSASNMSIAYHWKFYFLWFAVAFLLVGLLYITTAPNKNINKKVVQLSFSNYLIAMKDRFQIAQGFILFFYVGIEVGISYWLVTYLQEGYGFSMFMSNLYLLFFISGIIAGRFIGGLSIMKKLEPKTIITYSLLIVFCLIFSDLIILKSHIIIVLSGFFMSLIFPATIAYAVDNSPKNKESSISITLLISSSGVYLLPYLIGFSNDLFGITRGIFIILFFNLLTFPLLLIKPQQWLQPKKMT